MSQLATEVRIADVDLDPAEVDLDSLSTVLSADELARADRFVTAELRRRYIICRATLRKLLAERLQREPSTLRFHYQQWGKPQLADAPPGVHFNVTHSADRALIALSSVPVGIDLEVANDRIQFRSIARQVLSEFEKPTWEALPFAQQESSMMQLWVCKESLLKAMGLGIAEGLKRTTLPLPIPEEPFLPKRIDGSLQLELEEDASCQMNSWLDARQWTVSLIRSDEQATAALTTFGGTPKIDWIAPHS